MEEELSSPRQAKPFLSRYSFRLKEQQQQATVPLLLPSRGFFPPPPPRGPVLPILAHAGIKPYTALTLSGAPPLPAGAPPPPLSADVLSSPASFQLGTSYPPPPPPPPGVLPPQVAPPPPPLPFGYSSFNGIQLESGLQLGGLLSEAERQPEGPQPRPGLGTVSQLGAIPPGPPLRLPGGPPPPSAPAPPPPPSKPVSIQQIPVAPRTIPAALHLEPAHLPQRQKMLFAPAAIVQATPQTAVPPSPPDVVTRSSKVFAKVGSIPQMASAPSSPLPLVSRKHGGKGIF